MRGLGRRVQFDDRSRQFPVRALIHSAAKPRSYTWSCPVVLDQGQTGACVGFSFSHEAAARPVKVKDITNPTGFSVYHRAQKLDDFPDDEEGSSVLAGAKAGVELGWYTGYKWAFSIEDVILALGHAGPVVLGINWYEGMEEIDEDGFVQVYGEILGGHAILANGVNIAKKSIRLHNSWNDTWGRKGECFLSFDGLKRLLAEEGEACIPTGRKLPLLTRITGAILNHLPGA